MSSITTDFSTKNLTNFVLSQESYSLENSIETCKNFHHHMSVYFFKDMYATLTFLWNNPEFQEIAQKAMSLGIHEYNESQKIF